MVSLEGADFLIKLGMFCIFLRYDYNTQGLLNVTLQEDKAPSTEIPINGVCHNIPGVSIATKQIHRRHLASTSRRFRPAAFGRKHQQALRVDVDDHAGPDWGVSAGPG